MKKTTPILPLILFPLFSYSQKIKLSGEVYGYTVRHEPSKDKKLYYTFDKKPFNGQNYISYSTNYKYEWELALDKIKTDSIRELVFSTDTITNHIDEYSCVHRIRLDRILSSKRFRDKSDIQINCDLLLDFSCEASAYYGAREEGLERFIGTYAMNKDKEKEISRLNVKTRHQYNFEVIEDGDIISFKSNEYPLKKSHYPVLVVA